MGLTQKRCSSDLLSAVGTDLVNKKRRNTSVSEFLPYSDLFSQLVCSQNNDDDVDDTDFDVPFAFAENYKFNGNNNTLNYQDKSISRTGSFSSSSRKTCVPKSDRIAREHCFDYIVQAIDEVWARYCDTTSNAESIVYNDQSIRKGFKNSTVSSSHNHHSYGSSKPLKVSDDETGVSEDDYEDDDDTSGYKSEATNLTEYETDCAECRPTVSTLPDSIKLQSLKLRLMKAKNDLEDYYDSDNYDSCIAFWRRWDMIKYSAVEVMEDDDDDDVVENAIEELEEGRCFRD
ncbi:hypothetical protein NCAS_0B09050 [Naumovozyma castellii]|uniref:Uncharacterized protein n=1 Tax=Naumovozyma castellii TaxID=27288 RepID=G0VAW2_NAUCA|nr:hypothetical protein NCAS_0B09050 [Naumovozyma castellii CBS 4309]CCC68989.1 hypothetical protein NCAS_0B09050 [Naumovozyma castellii CBS 4309]